MTNFLMGKGYWEYIEGDLEEAQKIPEENATTTQIKVFKDWQEKCCIGSHLASQIRCLDIYKMLYFQRKLGTVW